MANYKKTSVYSNTILNKKYLGIYEPPITPNIENMKKYTITQKYHRRPDLMAYDLYGKSDYWWIFTILNRSVIKDPLFDFVEGLEIYIPNNLTQLGL